MKTSTLLFGGLAAMVGYALWKTDFMMGDPKATEDKKDFAFLIKQGENLGCSLAKADIKAGKEFTTPNPAKIIKESIDKDGLLTPDQNLQLSQAIVRGYDNCYK